MVVSFSQATTAHCTIAIGKRLPKTTLQIVEKAMDENDYLEGVFDRNSFQSFEFPEHPAASHGLTHARSDI
jgi:hypothetical protein